MKIGDIFLESYRQIETQREREREREKEKRTKIHCEKYIFMCC